MSERRLLYLTTRDVHHPRTGADNRAKYLQEGLTETFEVDLVCFDRREDGDEPSPGAAVSYPRSELLAIVSIRFLTAVLRRLFGRRYDGIVVSGIGASTYGLLARALQPGSILVFDDHNAEYELAANSGSRVRYWVVYALERISCCVASLVVVPTDEVRTSLKEWVTGNIKVVTNGFDAERFSPGGEALEFETRTLLYFGNFGYRPNAEAVSYIAEELCPDLDAMDVEARVLLAGPDQAAVAETVTSVDRVETLGFVEDLPALIRGVDLVIVPLRSGSGSRLKIIEALACGTPVVSTPLGAAGWPTEWTNLVLNDLESFAEATAETLHDHSFDDAEYDAIEHYSWQSQARCFVSYIQSTVEGSN